MTKKKAKVWVSTSEAAEALGVHRNFLLGQRDRLFRKGTHYRVLNPQAWRPTYRWHLKKVQELMEA